MPCISSVVHAAANRQPPGNYCRSAGRTANLCVHAREQDAFIGQLVHLGRFETTNLLDRGHAYIAKGRVVPHDVNQVRWLAELFFKLGKFLVELLVFFCPLISMLGFQDIIFSILNEVFRRGRGCKTKQQQGYES